MHYYPYTHQNIKKQQKSSQQPYTLMLRQKLDKRYCWGCLRTLGLNRPSYRNKYAKKRTWYITTYIVRTLSSENIFGKFLIELKDLKWRVWELRETRRTRRKILKHNSRTTNANKLDLLLLWIIIITLLSKTNPKNILVNSHTKDAEEDDIGGELTECLQNNQQDLSINKYFSCKKWEKAEPEYIIIKDYWVPPNRNTHWPKYHVYNEFFLQNRKSRKLSWNKKWNKLHYFIKSSACISMHLVINKCHK